MDILGIDPGIRKVNPTGVVLLRFESGKLTLLAHTLITPPSEGTWQARVQSVGTQLDKLLHTLQIDALAYEPAHFQRDLQTMRKLAALEGILLFLAAQRKLPALDIQPTQSKAALTGNAKADKAAMIGAAYQIFGLQLSPHCADAVGIALAGEALIRRQVLVGAV